MEYLGKKKQLHKKIDILLCFLIVYYLIKTK